MLVKVEAQTIAKTLQDVEVDALVDPHPEKLSVVVAQTIADALVKAILKALIDTQEAIKNN